MERSPIYYAEQARTPILIMHGKNDTRVHPSQSMELYRYLKTLAGKVPVQAGCYMKAKAMAIPVLPRSWIMPCV
ncbi:alpha/beta hydrolase family protein [Alishewanella longhuensis]